MTCDLVIFDLDGAGIEAAVAAGMTAVGFCGGSHRRPGHAGRLCARGARFATGSMAELASFIAEGA